MKPKIIISLLMLFSGIITFGQDKIIKDSIERVMALEFFDKIFQEQKLKEKRVQDSIDFQRSSYNTLYFHLKSLNVDTSILIKAEKLFNASENIFKYFQTFQKTLPRKGSCSTVAFWVDLEKACNDSIFKLYLTTVCNYSDLLLTGVSNKKNVNNILSYFRLIPKKNIWYEYFNWGCLEWARPDIEQRISLVVSIVFEELITKYGLTTAYNKRFCASWA